MWYLLPLATLLAVLALALGQSTGTVPPLPRKALLPILLRIGQATVIAGGFGLFLGFAAAKQAQLARPAAVLREARQRLAEKPRDPALWQAKVAQAEQEIAAPKGPLSPAVLLGPVFTLSSLILALSGIGGGLVVFRHRFMRFSQNKGEEIQTTRYN